MNLEAPKGKILNKPDCERIHDRCPERSIPINPRRLAVCAPCRLPNSSEQKLLQMLLAVCGFLSIFGITLLLCKSQPDFDLTQSVSLSSIGSRFKKTVSSIYKVDNDYLQSESESILKKVSDSINSGRLQRGGIQNLRMISPPKPVYASNLIRVSMQAPGTTSLAPLVNNKYESNLVQRKLIQIIRKRGRKDIDPLALSHKIIFESHQANFDPLFVAAVIKSESAFDKLAISSAGARGLMQILPSTGTFIAGLEGFEAIMKRRLTDPDYNVHLGIAYLKYLEQLYKGNRMLVLTAYNWGPGRVQDAIEGRRKIPAEVMTYALRILRDHQEWVNELMMAA